MKYLIYLRNWFIFIVLVVLLATIAQGFFDDFIVTLLGLLFGIGYGLHTTDTSFHPIQPRIDK